MKHQVKTIWKDNMAFESEIDSHKFITDAKQPLGNNSGPSPKKLLLSALAGCTGMDVVSLLKKMRVDFTDFEIDIEADLTDEHPKVYSHIKIIYKLYGTNIDKEKAKKAIELSQEKYCGVNAMLRKNSPIEYSIEYINS